MGNSLFRVFPAVLLLTLSYAASARADQLYQVNGTITSTGNNTCSPSPCTVTINYSYLLDAFSDPNLGDQVLSFNVSGSGSVGTVFTAGGWNTLSGSSGYIPIFDSSNDEIDLLSNFSPDGVLQDNFSFAQWYSCFSFTCFDGFLPPSVQALWGAGPVAFNVGNAGAYPFEISQTVAEVPEDSPGPVLIAGLICVALLWRPAKAFASRHRIAGEIS